MKAALFSYVQHFKNIFKNVYITVPAIFVVCGLFFVFATPPLWGVDEITHFGRVYQVSQGGIRAAVVGKDEIGGSVPANVNKLQGIVYKDLTSMHQASSVLTRDDYRHNNWYHPLIDQPVSNEKQFMNFPGSASYTPIVYIAPAIGIDIAMFLHFSLQWVIFIGRIFCLASMAAVLWYVLRSLDAYRTKWVFVVVALLPAVVYQSSIISADGATNALSFLLIGLFLKSVLSRHLTRTELILLLITAILLPLCKFNYGIMSILILFIPRGVMNASFPKLKHPKLLLWLTVGVAMILTAIWLYAVRNVGDVMGQLYFGPGAVDAKRQVLFILSHPLTFIAAFIRSVIISGPGYLQGLVGLMGWNFIAVPSAILIISFINLVLAVMWARSEMVKNKRATIYSGIIGAICALSIFGALYLAFSPVGDHYVEGVQGRYFIPLLVPLAMIMALVLPGSIRANATRFGVTVLSISSIGLVTAIGYYAMSTY